MKWTAKRQFLLLGIAALAAMSLSLYEKHGNLFRKIRTMAVSETRTVSELEAQAIRENEQVRQQGQEETTVGQEETAEEQKQTTAEVSIPDDPDIRVLLCSDSYADKYHNSVTLRATVPFTISYNGITENYPADEALYLDKESLYLRNGPAVLTLEGAGVFQFPLLERSSPCPSYEGTLTIEKRDEGLLVVNTLPLERYLCYVVPSEMPSSYPMEALKAQAVCARCYALRQLEGSRCAEYGADVDDSVSYQVYNNCGTTEEAEQAVADTAGLVMLQDGVIENALYYSTSCGIQMEEDLSEEAVFCSFLSGSRQDYEEEEPWYRWSVSFTVEELGELAQSLYPDQVGMVQDISVEKRESSGCAEVLCVSGSLGEIQIEGEYNIRKFLHVPGMEVTLQDGSTAPELGMLPSAFFYVTPLYEQETLSGFLLTGGGYGHGNGMSQNGAKHMALDGKSCQEILKYYYGDGVNLVWAA